MHSATHVIQTNARRQLLRGRGVVAVGVGDGLIFHIAVELLAPVRHPLREGAGESVPVAAWFAKKGGIAEGARRHGAVVEHRQRPVELGAAHEEDLQLLPCRHRSGKAAVEAAVAKHVEGLHVHEGADSVWNGAYEVGALELTAAQKGGRTEAERGEGGQHTSVGKRAASSARGSGWVSAHILVMELSQLSDSEQSELALFGPHSAPLQVPHGSDFEQPSPPRTFPTPALSQNFPHAAH
jgi:hypothetical protein